MISTNRHEVGVFPNILKYSLPRAWLKTKPPHRARRLAEKQARRRYSRSVPGPAGYDAVYPDRTD